MSENIPESCPGIDSKEAGKTSSCEGCPNQSLCSSGTLQEEKNKLLQNVQEKYKNVKQIIMIVSGKGGVGKSTIAMLLARGIVELTDFQVGYLDIDLCGPSAGRLFNLSGDIHQSNFGFTPLVSEEGISVMSTDFLLNSKTDAIVWRGSKKTSLISNLFLNTDWGDELDYLIIDTPPGTTDEHLSIVDLLKSCSQTISIMVYSPQEIALVDVRKQVNFLKKASIPLIGFIENMSYVQCPKCHTKSQVFPKSTQNIGTLTDVIPICNYPIDKELGFCESEGLNPYEYIRNSEHAIFKNIETILNVLKIPYYKK